MNGFYKKLSAAVIFFATVFISAPILAVVSPTANAGADIYTTAGQTVTLQGSAYDPNGYNLNYNWTCNGGQLANQNSLQPTFTTTPIVYGNYYNYSGQTSYTCTLTATSSFGTSSSDSMVVYASYGSGNYSVVQTNSAANILQNQATLNGYLSSISNYANYVSFQWGATTSYGNQTQQQNLNNTGSFSQIIYNLSPNTTYHYRAVAQVSGGNIYYGQDATFSTSDSGVYNNGFLNVDKKAINLTTGNLSWSSYVTARPGDVLSFAITLQAGGQNINNVTVRDTLPNNLIYKGNLNVNTNQAGGDIFSGINIGTVYINQAVVVSYQVQIPSASSFAHGITTINNTAVITSRESDVHTASATIAVNNSVVYGASTISTGITNNLLKDSFFLPLLILGSALLTGLKILRAKPAKIKK